MAQLIGIGNTAEVYEYETGKVCKLFFEGYPQEYVALEYRNAVEAFRLRLPVPKPFELITYQKRNGIIYEKITGEPLLSFMNKNGVGRGLDLFVKLHRAWLSHHSERVLSYKEYLSLMVQSRDAGNHDLIQWILALPDGDCILHGDFHPDNIIIKSSDKTPVVIDFMNLCRGPALYDVARTFFLLRHVSDLAANKYLEKMETAPEDIAKYLNVIQLCRKYESSGDNGRSQLLLSD